jgi:hypothetical protein
MFLDNKEKSVTDIKGSFKIHYKVGVFWLMPKNLSEMAVPDILFA